MAQSQGKYKSEVVKWQRRSRNGLREWRPDIEITENQPEESKIIFV